MKFHSPGRNYSPAAHERQPVTISPETQARPSPEVASELPADAVSPAERAEARRYGRIHLVLTLLDMAVDIVYLGLMAFVFARPLDAWLTAAPRSTEDVFRIKLVRIPKKGPGDLAALLRSNGTWTVNGPFSWGCASRAHPLADARGSPTSPLRRDQAHRLRIRSQPSASASSSVSSP